MGIFGNNIKRILREIRQRNESYSKDLGRDIRESFEDLKSDYDENAGLVSEFTAFVEEISPKLSASDAETLRAFSKRISKVDRNASNGVEAMYSLERNFKKVATESQWDIEEIEMELK